MQRLKVSFSLGSFSGRFGCHLVYVLEKTLDVISFDIGDLAVEQC